MGALAQAMMMTRKSVAGGIPAVVGQALLYTGNGGSRSITGASFSPDLVMTKRRAIVNTNWRWVDNVRGAGLSVSPHQTVAEASQPTGITSFDANGFSVGSDTDYNTSGESHLALVMQRVAGGFDIVTYTGTGVAHAENHGLGVVPELIFVFDRTNGGNRAVYAGPLSSPETKVLLLNSIAAPSACATCWNNTAPTSTQFTVGTASSINTNGRSYVAYLFASLNPGIKVGAYTGDGNPNGPSLTIGFQAKWVIVKRTDNSSQWIVFDDQRDPSSPHNTYNFFSSAGVEQVCTNTAGGMAMDPTAIQSIDSDGTNCAINISGATYLYLAVA